MAPYTELKLEKFMASEIEGRQREKILGNFSSGMKGITTLYVLLEIVRNQKTRLPIQSAWKLMMI